MEWLKILSISKKKKIETRMSPLSLHFNYECKSVEDASAGGKLEPYP